MKAQSALNKKFKSGFVSIIGRPNTGKSTLLNRLAGQKISIITPKPQTTRNRILGIWHGESAQIVFLDTPGIHKPSKKLNHRMVQTALKSISESDIVLVLVDTKSQPIEDESLLSHLRGTDVPIFLIINKIDIVKKPLILLIIDTYKDLFPFREMIPISALTGENCSDLVKTIISYLPYGPLYYPEDMVTDQTERFASAELIREKLILLTRQEIPYVCSVIIDDMFVAQSSDIVNIRATILVEKESQKGIIIGEKGRMLKEVGQKARSEIERLLGKQVYMEMWVKVSRNWRDDEQRLNQIGY